MVPLQVLRIQAQQGDGHEFSVHDHHHGIAGHCIFFAVMIFACTATADDQGDEQQGGKAVDKAPAGVELTTLLPEKISVDNGSHKTAITAVVKNGEPRTAEIPAFGRGIRRSRGHQRQGLFGNRRKGSPARFEQSFGCAVDNLAAGSRRPTPSTPPSTRAGRAGSACRSDERREEDVLAAGSGPVRRVEADAERPGDPTAARHRQHTGGSGGGDGCPGPVRTSGPSARRGRRDADRHGCGGPVGHTPQATATALRYRPGGRARGPSPGTAVLNRGRTGRRAARRQNVEGARRFGTEPASPFQTTSYGVTS